MQRYVFHFISPKKITDFRKLSNSQYIRPFYLTGVGSHQLRVKRYDFYPFNKKAIYIGNVSNLSFLPTL